MSVSRKVVFLVMGADGSGKAGLTVNTDFFAYYKIGEGTATAITSATDEGNGFYSASVSADTTDEVILTGKYTDGDVTLPVVGWAVGPWVVSTFDAANDGVILGATQSNYAPAKAGDIPTSTINAIKAKTDGLPASPAATGDAMTLTSAYDAAKGAAGANATATGFATPSDLTTLQTHGDSTWATATGFATPSDLMTLQTHGDSSWTTADISSLATSAELSSLQTHGDSNWATADVSGLATGASITSLQSHGDSSWATATGFATPSDLTTLQTHGDSEWATADVSGLATGASITSLQSHGDSSWATATGFSTFDPANDTVAHVTLVDTTTTNTDMRGTDNAYTGTPPTKEAIAAQVWADDGAPVVDASGRVTTSNPAAGGTVVISPILAVANNPAYTIRELGVVARGSAPTLKWTITDSSKAAVDLTGKTLRFVVAAFDEETECDPYDDTFTPKFQYETGGSGITVSGDDGNEVSVAFDADDTATAGKYKYWLWNITDDILLATGKLPIVPSVKSLT